MPGAAWRCELLSLEVCNESDALPSDMDEVLSAIDDVLSARAGRVVKAVRPMAANRARAGAVRVDMAAVLVGVWVAGERVAHSIAAQQFSL